MRRLVITFLLCLPLAMGCSIPDGLREDIAKTGPNFEVYAEASQPRDDLTPTEIALRKALEAEIREFFEKAGQVK